MTGPNHALAQANNNHLTINGTATFNYIIPGGDTIAQNNLLQTANGAQLLEPIMRLEVRNIDPLTINTDLLIRPELIGDLPEVIFI